MVVVEEEDEEGRTAGVCTVSIQVVGRRRLVKKRFLTTTGSSTTKIAGSTIRQKQQTHVWTDVQTLASRPAYTIAITLMFYAAAVHFVQ